MPRTAPLSCLPLLPAVLTAVASPVILITAGAPTAAIAATGALGALALAGVVWWWRGAGPACELASIAQRLLLQEHRELAVVLVDGQQADHPIVWISPGFTALTGYGPAQVLGRNCRFLQGADADPATVQAIRQAIAQRQPFYGRIRNQRQDGTRFWNALRITPCVANGHAYFLGIQSDVSADVRAEQALSDRQRAESALRASEELHRSVIAALDAGVVVQRRGGAIVASNAAAARILGLSEDQLLGRTSLDPRWRAIDGTGAPLPGERHPAMATLTTGQPVTGFLMGVAKPDGATTWLSINSAPVGQPGEDGLPGMVVVCFNDITAQRLATTAAENALAQAEAAARTKAEFLATMSHEIRTPLNGVIGMTGLLLDTALEHTQREYVETVRTCGESLLGLINDVLDFSKIEAGRLELEQVDFDLAQVAEEAVSLLADQAQQKALELLCDVAPTVPEQIHGDPLRLRQVLVNLLSNAVKFTELGRVALRISATQGEPPALVLRVEDTGIGIPADVLPRLFTSFTQADASTTRRFGGTGLGLAISRRLVELMGGGIAVASAPGHGTTFTVTLPLRVRVRGSSGPMPALAGVAVLVAEDRAETRATLARQLAAWGLRVHEAPDGLAALGVLRAQAAAGTPLRLALLDHRLPGMDALAVAQVVRGDPRLSNTALVLLTGLVAPLPESDLRRLGFSSALTKPVRRLVLLDAVRAVVEPLAPAPAAVARIPDEQLDLRVLVVEDNAVNQRVVLALLHKLGCRAEAVGNGREALGAITAVPYDLVLMDCQMPEMDGFDATAEIRRREAAGIRLATRGRDRLPVIALTANALHGDRERCLAVGMDGYLTKPVRREPMQQELCRFIVTPAPADPAAPGAPAPRAAAAPVPSTSAAGEPAIVDPLVINDLIDQLGEGGAAVVHDLIGDFLSESAQVAARLDEAIAAADATRIAHQAHRLKGLCLTVGAAAAASECLALERAGHAGTAAGALVDGPAQRLRAVLPSAGVLLLQRQTELRP